MRKRIRIAAGGLAFVIAIGLAAEAAVARSGPAIAGNADIPECRTALQMATSAFRSTDASLLWPIPKPDPAQAKVVLARNVREIGGGNPLEADTAVFGRIEPQGSSVRPLFWQRTAAGGRRIAVIDEIFNWEGDWYYLLDLPAETSPDDLIKHFEESEKAGRTPSLLRDEWTPPLVLQNRLSGALWAIDQGGGEAMPSWTVLTSSPAGLKAACSIDFTPGTKPGLRRLPAAVQRFAAAADEALGPDDKSGTLQPTARIRVEIEKSWAIVSERPWALTDTPYNSRGEVDRGLKAWARPVPARVRVYDVLRARYRAATAALAGFYQSRFHLPAAAADSFSAFAMDHMLRSYFVFPSDDREHAVFGPDRVDAIPWPKGIR